MVICECENTRLMLIQAERYEDVAIFDVKYKECRETGCRCNCIPTIYNRNINNDDTGILKKHINTLNSIIDEQRRKIDEQSEIICILKSMIGK